MIIRWRTRDGFLVSELTNGVIHGVDGGIRQYGLGRTEASMRILDRQRYWAFFKAYVICFIALVGLYVVIDAMTNLDEFAKVEDKTLGMLQFMGRYYLVRLSLFYDRLGGVITMLAAIFTVTWMQRNNEHLAMMAAGISTHRAIRPVLIAAALVSLGAVANQETIIPRIAEELQRTPDDDGKRVLRSFGRRDLNGVAIPSADAFRSHQTIKPFHATFPTDRYGVLLQISGKSQGRYIPPGDRRSPLRGGWLIRNATVSPVGVPLDGAVLSRLDPDAPTNLASLGSAGMMGQALIDAFPPPHGKDVVTRPGTLFLRTNLTFTALIQSRLWYQFAPTTDLVRSLSDPTYQIEWQEIGVFLHSRNIRPLLSLALLGLSLPLVLSGYGRNTFINLGFSLVTSAVFYIILFVVQWLGNNKLMAPALAAWAPLLLFGTIAAARWDRIRT